MKLSIIKEAGHWEVPGINYPNNIAKGKVKKNKRPMSFLLHPEDREEFFGGITMGLQEEQLDAAAVTKDVEEIPQSNADKIKSDSINDKNKKDREKMLLQKKVQPVVNNLNKNIKQMQDTIAAKKKQAETDKQSYDSLSNDVTNVTKTFGDISKFIK